MPKSSTRSAYHLTWLHGRDGAHIPTRLRIGQRKLDALTDGLLDVDGSDLILCQLALHVSGEPDLGEAALGEDGIRVEHPRFSRRREEDASDGKDMRMERREGCIGWSSVSIAVQEIGEEEAGAGGQVQVGRCEGGIDASRAWLMNQLALIFSLHFPTSLHTEGCQASFR